MHSLKTYLTLLLATATLTSALAIPKSNPSSAHHPTLNARNVTNPSVYVCQNFDWDPPCLFIPLGSSENSQQNFWMAPAPGGPGPFRTSNYTVGSWGPSQGVSTYWVDNYGNKSAVLGYPGTGRVDSYWGGEIWTWWPSWDA